MSSPNRHHTSSPSASLDYTSSLNHLHTPSPPVSAGQHAHTPHNRAEEVDWQEEYRKLHIKYNALKEKIRFLEQSNQGGECFN